MPAFECRPGLRATVAITVSNDDTAVSMGSGDVDVLATPRVLGLAEQAAVQALAGCLPADHTSVGSWVELEHRAVAHVGTRVSAEAVLLGVHGRRLEFSITITRNTTEIAHCRHRRVIVERDSFQRG